MKSLYIFNFAVSYFAIISLFVGITSSLKNPKLSIYRYINGRLQPISETVQDRDELHFKNRAAELPSYKSNNEIKVYKVFSIPDNENILSRLLKDRSNTPAGSEVKYTVLKTNDQDLDDTYDNIVRNEDATLESSLEDIPVVRVVDNEDTLSRVLKDRSNTPSGSYTLLKTNDQDVKDTYDINKRDEDATLESSAEHLPVLRVGHKRNKLREGPKKKQLKLKVKPDKINKLDKPSKLSLPIKPNKRNKAIKFSKHIKLSIPKKQHLRTNINDTEPNGPHIHMYKLLNDDNYEDREQSDEHVSLQELPAVVQNLLNNGPSDAQDRNDNIDNEGLKQRIKSKREGVYLLSHANDDKELSDNNISKGSAYELLSLLAKSDGKPSRLAQDKDKTRADDLLKTLNQGNKRVILLPIKTLLNSESNSKNDPRQWAAQFNNLYSNEKDGKDLIHFIDSTNDTEPKKFDDMTRLDEHTKVLQLLAKKGVLPKSLKLDKKHILNGEGPLHSYLRSGFGDDRTAPPRKQTKYDDPLSD